MGLKDVIAELEFHRISRGKPYDANFLYWLTYYLNCDAELQKGGQS